MFRIHSDYAYFCGDLAKNGILSEIKPHLTKIKEAKIETHDSKHFINVENLPFHVNHQEIDNMTDNYIEMIEEPEILEFKIENLENEDEIIEASGDYSNSHKSESDHVENTIQSTEIEKFTEENEMVDSGKKSELKKVKNAKSGCSKLKMSSDVIELIRNQCGKHKSAAMAKALNVSVRAVQR